MSNKAKSIGRDFKSSVFRKTSHTGLMLNFSAICPYRWKIGLISCMLYKAYNICCNWYSFTNTTRGNQSIHYYTILWNTFDRKLRQSFKRHSFNITKIKNFFSLKCPRPTPKLLKANVVYKFDCLCDINIFYIGKTKRHLANKG